VSVDLHLERDLSLQAGSTGSICGRWRRLDGPALGRELSDAADRMHGDQIEHGLQADEGIGPLHAECPTRG
jgi:hypothetical protein